MKKLWEVRIVVESQFQKDIVRRLALEEVRHIFPEALITSVQETEKRELVPNPRRDRW